MGYMFDKELELRAVSAGAVTATGQTSAFALKAAHMPPAKVALHVTAVDRGNADETYVFTVEVDTASGFASPVTVATLPSITATGVYELPISKELIEKFEAGTTHLRVKYTIGGTSPSITFGAFLVPVG